jgi:exodeoxyribonuclease-3
MDKNIHSKTNMNIWTWNVNSIRSKIGEVNALLKRHNIDILVLTETKIKPDHEMGVSQQLDTNYSYLWNSNKTSYYHGVGIIYRKELDVSVISTMLPRLVTDVDQQLCCMKNQYKIKTGLSDTKRLIDDMTKAQTLEGRILTVKCITPQQNEFIIVGTYVPNSGVSRGDSLKRLGYRVLVWDKDVYSYLSHLERQYQKVVWIGDLNVARKDNDMNRNTPTCAGTTPEERINMNTFLQHSGWVDSWDHINPEMTDYHNRWTYGMEKGCKLRLDYVICSPQLKDYIVSSTIDHKFGTSDHVPMGTVFNL